MLHDNSNERIEGKNCKNEIYTKKYTK